MMKYVIGILLALSGAVVWAQLQQSNSIQTVIGSGRNADYRTAVYEALVQAASQVQGVSLQDSRDAFMDSMAQIKKTGTENSDISEIRESLKQSVSAKTKGRVLSYRITAEKYVNELGLWYIELEAKVPGQYVVGLHPDNRRRLIVVPFRSLSPSVTVLGTEVRLGNVSETIADRLNQDLTQTRRFTMLDRTFDAEVQAELSRLGHQNASAVDAGRSQQLLVTDYLVAGTVRAYAQPAAVHNQYTGMTSAPDGPCLEVSYRVILAPTSQLKWSGTVTVPYSACSGAGAEALLQSAYAVASKEICRQIIDNIYPMRVTAKMTYELVLNQGGSNVREGMIYDVFRQGEVIADVSSGETLGAPEELVARVRVTRVTPKMSYAVVVEGTPIDQIEIGAVVRRSSAVAAGGAPAGAASPVQVTPSGAVIPPWKRK